MKTFSLIPRFVTVSIVAIGAAVHTPLPTAGQDSTPPVRIAQAGGRVVPRPVRPGPIVNPPRPKVAGEQSQTLSFGGGGSFQFLIPVSGPGQVTANVSWSGRARNAEALLFDPDQKTPVARAEGRRGVTVAYKATKPGTMELAVEFEGAAPGISGRVTVTWPGSPESKLVWSDAFAPSPQVRQAMDRRMARLGQLLGRGRPSSPGETKLKSKLGSDHQFREHLETLTEAYAARMRAVDAAPAGSVSVLVVPAAKEPVSISAPGGQGEIPPEFTGQKTVRLPPLKLDHTHIPPGDGLGELMTISFMQLFCKRECKYDGLSNSDEPYFMIGIVKPDTVERARSDVFRDVDSGESRPLAGMANEQIWQGRIKEPSYICIQMMEHDTSDLDKTLRNFADALETSTDDFHAALFPETDYEVEDPGDAFALVWKIYFETIFKLILCGRGMDDKLGPAVWIRVTPQEVAYWRDSDRVTSEPYGQGMPVIRCFQGSGFTKEAEYWLTLKFH